MLYGIFYMTLAVSDYEQWRFLACIDPLAEDIVVHGTDDDLGIESVLSASFQEMSFYDARDVVLVYRIERPALMVLHQKEPVDIINTYKALVITLVWSITSKFPPFKMPQAIQAENPGRSIMLLIS